MQKVLLTKETRQPPILSGSPLGKKMIAIYESYLGFRKIISFNRKSGKMCHHIVFWSTRDNPVRQGEIEQSFQCDGWKTEGPVFIRVSTQLIPKNIYNNSPSGISRANWLRLVFICVRACMHTWKTCRCLWPLFQQERETSLQRNVGWLEWYFFSLPLCGLIKYVIQFQIEQSSWINAERNEGKYFNCPRELTLYPPYDIPIYDPNKPVWFTCPRDELRVAKRFGQGCFLFLPLHRC